MIYLILGMLFSATLSLLMRVSEKHIKGDVAMLAVNYISCSIVALLDAGAGNIFTVHEGMGRVLLVGICAGAVYLTGFALLQYNIQKNGVVLPATFMKLGLLVSVATSVVIFGERLSLIQTVGFVLAVAAIVLINYKGKDKNAEKTNINVGLLLLLLFFAGAGDAFTKVFDETCNPVLSDHYLLITFVTACLLCLGLMVYKKQRIGKAEWAFGFLLGVPNYLSSKMVLVSLNYLPAVVVFPTFCVGCIVIVTLAGVFFFKERLTKRQYTALAMIMAALAMLNL